LILAGLLGGVFGGMGMGGGTLLIPLLTVMCGVPQHTAQSINLAAFIPMAAAALFIHFKNKVIDVKGVWPIIIPAVAVSVFAALLAQNVDAVILKKLFGGFIALIGVYQIITEIKGFIPSGKGGGGTARPYADDLGDKDTAV
jgi:uncharacterized membrane protein YfcA